MAHKYYIKKVSQMQVFKDKEDDTKKNKIATGVVNQRSRREV